MRRIARHLGFADEDDEDEVTPLRPMRQAMVRGSARLLVATAIATGAAIAFLDWDPARVAVGAAIGIVVFAPIEWFTDVRRRVPLGPLPPVPPGAAWEGEDGARAPVRSLLRTALILCVAAAFVAWVVHEEGELLGAIFLPGQLIGYTLAELLGARRVDRWEERHGLRVVFRHDGGEIQRYAADPLTLLARR